MNDYKTIVDKAAEWNVSPRHIQHLCKDGKIEGAVKLAGAWFIPNDTPAPVKNTKTDVKDFAFVGTKQRIFENAITLFTKNGFENVGVGDIAYEVGIRQSAIYHHFKSKQEILDTIYDFYCYHFLKNRPRLEEVEPIIMNGSLYDIVLSGRYSFDSQCEQKMLEITRIIFRRSSIDERARQIQSQMVMKEGIDFIKAVFDKAVSMGRIAPIDTHVMAVFINGVRLFALHNWILDPTKENLARIEQDELAIYEHAVRLLTDRKNEHM